MRKILRFLKLMVCIFQTSIISLIDVEILVEFFPKMLSDVNAACLDLAVDTAIAFADKAPMGFMSRNADAWFGPIVDKTFGGKPALMLKYALILDCL